MHQMQHLSLSAMLLSITINAFINTFIIDKYNFITLCTITMFIIWTILQFYIDKKLKPVYITDQKFIAIILTIVVSLTQRYRLFKYTINIYVCSILAPAIFIIGGIMLFISTFNNLDETAENNNKIKKLMIKGLIIINISFIVMMVLTPYYICI